MAQTNVSVPEVVAKNYPVDVHLVKELLTQLADMLFEYRRINGFR